MSEERKGRFAGLPNDWRPTADRVRRRAWNPDESRVLVPKVFGWGYTINFAALVNRVVRRRR